MRIVYVVILIVSTGSIFGQNAKVDLSKITWLHGCWERLNERSGRTTFEQWTKPDGGTLFGIGRTISGGKVVSWEFMRIEQKDGSAVFSAQLPSSSAATPFVLKTASERELIFENPENDFPQRVIYRTKGADSLEARIEGKMNGTDRGIDYPFKRVKCE